MSCDWEGNRRSSVALAMRNRLKWFIHLRAQGSTPPTLFMRYGTLYLYIRTRAASISEFQFRYDIDMILMKYHDIGIRHR